jgi:hypothetical protein
MITAGWLGDTIAAGSENGGSNVVDDCCNAWDNLKAGAKNE